MGPLGLRLFSSELWSDGSDYNEKSNGTNLVSGEASEAEKVVRLRIKRKDGRIAWRGNEEACGSQVAGSRPAPGRLMLEANPLRNGWTGLAWADLKLLRRETVKASR